MVRRARWRITAGTAVIITLLVTAVGGIAYAVTVRGQDDQVWRELRYSTAVSEPTAPPGCTWVFAPGTPAPPHSPAGFPIQADFDSVAASGTPVERTVEREDAVYLVRTQPRAGGVVQGVFDLRFQLADRDNLLVALAIAELVGLLAAGATGWVLGRRAVSPLAEALARQRRFVTDASHELRTPITQAYTRAQVLARQAGELPAAHRDGLARVVGSIGRLGEIIDDLLLSARLAAGGPDDGTRPVDLAVLAETAVADEADRARDRGLSVSVDRPSGALLVDGVESALRRAVAELLANAIRHTPAAGRIELTLARVATDVELTVSDTGDGFAPEEAERIFDRFHHGAATGPDRHEGRYGLGLALLREVVTSHRGTVVATAHPGRGARFTIRLPALTP